MSKASTQIQLNPSPKAVLTTPKPVQVEQKKIETAEMTAKETSPTLVEFQNRNAELPDWRLQIKNAVQQHLGKDSETSENVATIGIASVPTSKAYPTSGGNALKAEIIEEKQPEKINDEKLANALKRIELSRQKYYVVEPIEAKTEVVNEIINETPAKEFPFKIAARNDNPVPETNVELKDSVNFPTKPKLVPTPEKVDEPKSFKSLYDTSELDPNFIPAKISSSFEKRSLEENFVETKTTQKTKKVEKPIEETVVKAEKVAEPQTALASEFDDLAPFSLRFNAGVFDLLIGTFASLILLSPFMLLGGNWVSVAGFFAFLATCSIVMFIYLTTTIGIFGKSFGMHLFRLEMIDFDSDEYPTFHQSAVNSSIYLLSLAFVGLGFVPAFFDENRRAVHDLVAKTVVVREI